MHHQILFKQNSCSGQSEMEGFLSGRGQDVAVPAPDNTGRDVAKRHVMCKLVQCTSEIVSSVVRTLAE